MIRTLELDMSHSTPWSAPQIKHDTTATISVNTIVASLYMTLGKLKEAKELLDDCNQQLELLPGMSPVHSVRTDISIAVAAFYRS